MGRGLGFCFYSDGSIGWISLIICDEHLSVNLTRVVLFDISGEHFENT